MLLVVCSCGTVIAASEDVSIMDVYEKNESSLEEPSLEQQSEQTVKKKGEVTDQEITAAVKEAYASVPDLSFFNIQVQTVNGEVFLSATVRYYRQYQRAIEYAQRIPGVKKVNADKLFYFERP